MSHDALKIALVSVAAFCALVILLGGRPRIRRIKRLAELQAGVQRGSK